MQILVYLNFNSAVTYLHWSKRKYFSVILTSCLVVTTTFYPVYFHYCQELNMYFAFPLQKQEETIIIFNSVPQHMILHVLHCHDFRFYIRPPLF